MKLDLSRFKKVKEDHQSATLQHPDGHQIRVAKNVLSPQMKGDLERLPVHLNSEGEVPDNSEDQPAPQQQPQQQPQQPTIVINAGNQAPNPIAQMPAYDPQAAQYNLLSDPNVGNKAKEELAAKNNLNLNPDQINAALPQTGGRLPVEQVAEAPAPNPQSTISTHQLGADTQPAGDPYGNDAFGAAYTQGLQEQKAGLGLEGQAAANEGQLQAGALKASLKNQQAQAADYQTHYAGLNDEYNHFISDVQNQHVDPQHYLHSMGTGQKIATAIGLVLGGFGSGITHQQNPAMAFLNDQIQRDVNSQTQELGKRENLLQANMKQFGNLHDASMMTNAMQMGIVSNQLKLAAASAASPLAKARALQAAGQLDQQSAGMLSQLAMRRTLSQGAQQSQNPALAVQYLVPEKERGQATKELAMAQSINAMKQNYLQSFDDISSKFMNGALSPVDVKSAKQAFIGKIIKESEGRYNFEAAQNLADALFPKTFQSKETTQKERMRGIELLDSMAQTPTLDAYGIKPQTPGAYTPQGESKYKLQPPQIKKNAPAKAGPEIRQASAPSIGSLGSSLQ